LHTRRITGPNVTYKSAFGSYLKALSASCEIRDLFGTPESSLLFFRGYTNNATLPEWGIKASSLGCLPAAGVLIALTANRAGFVSSMLVTHQENMRVIFDVFVSENNIFEHYVFVTEVFHVGYMDTSSAHLL
jgi:hypothetical protein